MPSKPQLSSADRLIEGFVCKPLLGVLARPSSAEADEQFFNLIQPC